ncbi:hypothetical protein Dsin_007933 [Dipteronia sinensis]|uniref:Uncharacterized protein n=1 Tax=Dipteronia sinensis TaxID=43782 RepID=A0AAE0B136_9ROSI|nr:hypothetical protein Dsin_007933 [Dipteronia sinensis]
MAGVSENSSFVDRWRWSRPDVSIYTSLVQGLAASLKVSDALRLIDDICRVGVSPGEEVPFGKVVKCPTCSIAVAVAQPQHGIQLPQRSVEVIAIKQQLLSQYDVLQSRIKELKEVAEKEISSMIEIEVEMDYDVLAAEEVSSTLHLSNLIEQLSLELQKHIYVH